MSDIAAFKSYALVFQGVPLLGGNCCGTTSLARNIFTTSHWLRDYNDVIAVQ